MLYGLLLSAVDLSFCAVDLRLIAVDLLIGAVGLLVGLLISAVISAVGVLTSAVGFVITATDTRSLWVGWKPWSTSNLCRRSERRYQSALLACYPGADDLLTSAAVRLAG
jgi:hypothetical protein